MSGFIMISRVHMPPVFHDKPDRTAIRMVQPVFKTVENCSSHTPLWLGEPGKRRRSRATAHFIISPSPMAESDFKDYAEIVVVRHGETSWNAERRIQGQLDVELNDAGRQQAAKVAERLSKEPKISYVYSSDLKRAFETAEIIAASCGGLEVLTDPNLRERHLGDMQGIVYQEAPRTCPEAYKAFLSHRTDVDIPGGGESLDKLYDRCTSALQKIGDNHKGQRVVVVTHGGVLRSLYERAQPDGRNSGKVLNTSVNVFHLYEGEKWKIEVWGDVSHLDKTGFLQSGFGGDRTSG